MNASPKQDWPNDPQNKPVDVAAARQALLEMLAKNGGTPKGYLEYIRYLREHEGLSYRVEYNVGCYWTGRAKAAVADKRPPSEVTFAAEEALGALRRGLERGELAPWAKRDPSLRWWQSAPDEWKRKFEELLAQAPTPAAEASDLNGADPVGLWAETLSSVGVRTGKSLELRTRSAAARDSLQEELTGRASAELIARWADFASFFALDGVDVAHANLFMRSGLVNRRGLTGRSAAELRERLVEMNSAAKLVEAVPTETQLEHWIARASAKNKTKA